MIPVHEPVFEGNELRYLEDCIRSGWISSEGPFVKQFEESIAKRVGMQEGVAVCNGTAALEVALFALDLRPGAEVIMPSFTIISCAFACMRLGLVPVLVDIEAESWTMDPEHVKRRITPKTGAIMAVHIYGNPVNMDPILTLAKRHRIKLVEDFAEAQGAGYRSEQLGKTLQCGAMGDVSATSFYSNKLITCGEGGMVLCRTQEQAERARSYRNLAFDRDRRFIHEHDGFNYRMTNLQAAIGVAQLEQLDVTISRKRIIASWYREALSSVKGLRFHFVPKYSEPVYWMFCVELLPEAGCDAEYAVAQLKQKGIGCRYFFRGMHVQPVFAKSALFEGETLPKTEHASRFGFYLPSGTNLTQRKVLEIAAAVRSVLKTAN